MNNELDTLLRNMAAKEEPIPKGFSTTKDFAKSWGRSLDRTCDILKQAAEEGFAERRQVARRCGQKTMKIWVYKLT